jgi:tripartite-type tricarboxylate transporter receptor subunit TctC
MKSMLRGLVFAFALLLPLTAGAETWPAKPIRIIVPFPAGGPTDMLSRFLGERLTQSLGQQVIIDNRPGAGGNIGAEAVARAPSDGYTFLLASQGVYVTNNALFSKTGYEPQTDFAMVSLIAAVPNVIVVGANAPIKSIPDLIAFAKAHPGQATSGSGGNGSAGHLSLELLKTVAAVDIAHVPYRGSAPMLADLLGGQTTMAIDALNSALPYVQDGRLRAIAVTTTQRSSSLPDVPTVAEQGIAGYESSAWFAVAAPARTPEAIVSRLSKEIDAALKSPDLSRRIRDLGAEPLGGSPADITGFAATEREKWTKLIERAHVKVD